MLSLEMLEKLCWEAHHDIMGPPNSPCDLSSCDPAGLCPASPFSFPCTKLCDISSQPFTLVGGITAWFYSKFIFGKSMLNVIHHGLPALFDQHLQGACTRVRARARVCVHLSSSTKQSEKQNPRLQFHSLRQRRKKKISSAEQHALQLPCEMNTF